MYERKNRTGAFCAHGVGFKEPQQRYTQPGPGQWARAGGNARMVVNASMPSNSIAVMGGGKKVRLGEYYADENGVRTYYYTEPLGKNVQLPERAVAHVNVSNKQEYMLAF